MADPHVRLNPHASGPVGNADVSPAPKRRPQATAECCQVWMLRVFDNGGDSDDGYNGAVLGVFASREGAEAARATQTYPPPESCYIDHQEVKP